MNRKRIVEYNVPTVHEMNEILGMIPLVEKQIRRCFKVYEDGTISSVCLVFASGLTLHHKFKGLERS